MAPSKKDSSTSVVAPSAEVAKGEANASPHRSSRADYRSVLAQLHEPVVIVNENGRICFMNPAGQRCLGKGLAGRLEEYLKTERGKRSVSTASFSLNGEGKITFEIARREIEWTGKPAVLLALHDVSRYMKGAQRARNLHLRRLTLLDQVPSVTYVVALGDHSASPFLSPRFEDLLGRPRHSWQGHPELWRQYIQDEDYHKVVEELTQAISNQQPFTAEYRMTTESGDTVWVHEEASIRKDDGSDPCFLTGFLVDITDKKSRENELQAARSRLEGLEEKHAKELRSSHGRLQHELAQARMKLNNLKTERDLMGKQLNGLSTEIAATTAKLADQTSRRERADKENKDFRIKSEAAIQSVKTLTATKDRIEEQLSERSGEALRAADQFNKEVSRRKRTEKDKAELKEQLSAAKKRAEEIEAERNRSEEDLSERTSELGRAEGRLRQRTDELKQEREKAKQLQADRDKGRKETGELKKSRDSLDKQLKERSEEAQSAGTKLQRETDQRERTEKENHSLRERLASAGRAVRKATECRQRLERWAQDRVAEWNKANKQLAEVSLLLKGHDSREAK